MTGAGGSIGSELCRQIARVEPAQARAPRPRGARAVRDRARARPRARVPGGGGRRRRRQATPSSCARCSTSTGPGVVFHAAAYKHVAMMEANPIEAVRNNTLGHARGRGRRGRVRGEALRARLDRQGREPEDRDGPVEGARRVDRRDLGPPRGRRDALRRPSASATSSARRARWCPIFRRQIARGGPVTVTHPEMTRFFMTIPEAVQLIVQAGAIGGRGQVYVLDMGEPVRIVDLAEKMIRLSGKEPGTEIADRVHRAGAGREAPRGAGRGRRDGGAEPASEDRPDHPSARRRRLARGASSRCSSGSSRRGRPWSWSASFGGSWTSRGASARARSRRPVS